MARSYLLDTGPLGRLAHPKIDGLKSQFLYLPLDTPTMLKAAEFWGLARNRGKPAADVKELDGDVILAAQAERAGAGVLTENVGHLSVFVQALHWRDFMPR